MKLFVATILLAAHALAAPSHLGGGHHGSHHDSHQSSGAHHQPSGHHDSGHHLVAASSHHNPVAVSHHDSGHHGSSSHHQAASHHFVTSASHHSPVVVSHHSSGSHHDGGHHDSGHHAQAAASTDQFFVAQGSGDVPVIVKDLRSNPDEFGNYNFEIETDDGTVREETGKLGDSGAVVQTGSYSFTHPDGQTFELRYVADEGGYRVESPFLPPLPAFVLEQIAFAEANPELN